MKNILVSAIVLFFISLNVNGQVSRDTLYLKNGYKAAGKLLRQSKTECRFLSSDGIYFTFSRDEVEKIITTPELIIRKVNPDTLSLDLLNLYRDKAVKMRNAGRALTIAGTGVMVISFVGGILLMNTSDGHSGEHMGGLLSGFYVMCLGGMVGIPCTATGIPLWAVGGSRNAKAELALKRFDIPPENQMAVGVGISIKF